MCANAAEFHDDNDDEDDDLLNNVSMMITTTLRTITQSHGECVDYDWDDHDYGPNDGDRGYTLKAYTKQAFSLFWGNPQPYDAEGNYTTFQWGDVQIFLLDNRTFRSPNKSKTGKRTILGEKLIPYVSRLP